MDAQNYKNVCPKVFDFTKYWKFANKYSEIREHVFAFILYCKEEDAHR